MAVRRIEVLALSVPIIKIEGAGWRGLKATENTFIDTAAYSASVGAGSCLEHSDRVQGDTFVDGVSLLKHMVFS